MKSDAVRLAKIAADRALLHDVMSNPVIELLAGIAVITYLNKGSQSWLESISGIDLAAGSEYAGLITVIGLQQIAPMMPAIVQGVEGVGKALPGLLAIAGA